jgi:hypothetical protein
MKSYCILRTEKLKSFLTITGSAKHTLREIPTPNADASRTHLNKTWGAQNAAAVRRAIRDRLPTKRRRDAVLAIEYLVTASPEWFKSAPKQQQNSYFAASVRWLEARHGKANVICVNMQLDEKSPHLVAYVVPLTKDGRLSAKDFLGGQKVLTEMQTEFATQVGNPVGLQRGIEGSRAIHSTAKEFNAALNKKGALVPLEPPKPTFGERVTGRARKMEAEHAAAVDQRLSLANKALAAAEFGEKARISQAAALDQMRLEIDAAKEHQANAARLREENARLQQAMLRQQAYFQREIAYLKSALSHASDQIKKLLARIGALTYRPEVQPAVSLRSAIAPTFSAVALEEDEAQSSISLSPNRV